MSTKIVKKLSTFSAITSFNGIVQVIIFFGAIFYIAYNSGADTWLDIILAIAGFVAIATTSIVFSAINEAHKLQEKQVKKKGVDSVYPLVTLPVLLLRSFYTWIAYTIFCIGLLILLVGSTAGLMWLLFEPVYVNFSMPIVTFAMLVLMICTFTWLILMTKASRIIQAFVDFRLYKNDIILALLYEDDDRLLSRKYVISTVTKVIKETVLYALFVTTIGVLGAIAQIKDTHELSNADMIFVAVFVVSVIIIAVMNYFKNSHHKQQDNYFDEHIDEEIEIALEKFVEFYGAGSQQVKSFQTAFHTDDLSVKEKTRIWAEYALQYQIDKFGEDSADAVYFKNLLENDLEQMGHGQSQDR